MSDTNYLNINRPYNNNLERSEGGVVANVSDLGEFGSDTVVSGENNSILSDSSVPISSTKETITSGQSLDNLWINSWIKSTSYKPKTQGFLIDGKAGYIEANKLFIGSGGIIGGSLDIPDTTTANSFHVDSSGNTWWGAAAIGSAVAKVLNTGAATFTNITITGVQAGSDINGAYLTANSVASAAVNLALRGWTQTSVFSASDADTVAWTAGTFTASDGTAYSIGAGNTGNMSARTYIYLDIATSTTAYQVTTTATTAIGNGKCLIAVAENGTSIAEFQLFGGIGGIKLSVADLAADSTVTNEFVANTANISNAIITDAKIADLAVSKLTAGTITSKAITLAIAAGTGDSYIAGGNALDFTNWYGGDGSGGAIMLGLDDSDSDKGKFFAGNYSTGQYAQFDGTNFYVNDCAILLSLFYGDGSDGDVSITSNTALTSDMYYDDLSVSNNAILSPAGYRIFVKGTLTIASGSSVAENGGNGGVGGDGLLNSAQEGLGGTAGTAAHSAGYYPAPKSGKEGQDGGQGSANSNALNNDEAGGSEDGLAGDASTDSVGANGVAAGAGGNGGNSPGYSGGTGAQAGGAGTATAADEDPRNIISLIQWIDFSTIGTPVKFNGSAGSGSGGGGGGASGAFDGSARYGGGGGAGGGSGAPGGFVGIFARKIVNNGVISANGGNGGNGGNGNNGTVGYNTGGGGAGGGGGGGSGGVLSLAYNSYSGSGTKTVTGGSAGSAGTPGTGYGTGTAGSIGGAGTAGGTGVIMEFQN